MTMLILLWVSRQCTHIEVRGTYWMSASNRFPLQFSRSLSLIRELLNWLHYPVCSEISLGPSMTSFTHWFQDFEFKPKLLYTIICSHILLYRPWQHILCVHSSIVTNARNAFYRIFPFIIPSHSFFYTDHFPEHFRKIFDITCPVTSSHAYSVRWDLCIVLQWTYLIYRHLY